jgi:muramidase (phage lysozyme)
MVDLADDFIGKDLEYLDFKSKLDSAIKKAFSPKFQFEITKQQIRSELSEDLLRKIETALKKKWWRQKQGSERS